MKRLLLIAILPFLFFGCGKSFSTKSKENLISSFVNNVPPAIMCAAMIRTVTSPANNVGATQTCVATLPSSNPSATAITANPVTNGGSYSLVCQSNDQWAANASSSSCPAPSASAPAISWTTTPAINENFVYAADKTLTFSILPASAWTIRCVKKNLTTPGAVESTINCASTTSLIANIQGDNAYRVQVFGSAGEILATSTDVRVQIDKVAPTFTIADPPVKFADGFTFTLIPSETISYVIYKLDGVVIQSAGIGLTYSATVNDFNLHTVEFRVSDAAGNISAPVTKSFQRVQAPTPTPIEPKIWVVIPDHSLAQYPTEVNSVLSDKSILAAQAVSVFLETKVLGNFPVSLPISFDYALTGGHTPTVALGSGVFNAFQIYQKDLDKAQAYGFSSATPDHLFSVPCEGKDSILAFGQSNSANSGSVADQAISPSVFMFYNGYCFPARDPLLGASIFDGGGSLWLPLAKKYASETGRPIVIVSFGVGGTEISKWNSGGVFVPRLSQVLADVKKAKLNIIKIFWHQGESDNGLQTTTASYLQNFANIQNSFSQQGINVKFSIAVATYLSFLPYNVSRDVQEAQLSLIENNPASIELGVNTDFYHTPYRSVGDLHLNQLGLTSISNEWYGRAFTNQNTDMELIRTYYQIYLNRNPDVSGFNYWINQKSALGGLKAVREAIKNSNEGFIRDLYRCYTGRIPDQEGYNYWLAQLTRGTSRAALESVFVSTVNWIISSESYDTSLYELRDGKLLYIVDKWAFSLTSGLWEKK